MAPTNKVPAYITSIIGTLNEMKRELESKLISTANNVGELTADVPLYMYARPSKVGDSISQIKDFLRRALVAENSEDQVEKCYEDILTASRKVCDLYVLQSKVILPLRELQDKTIKVLAATAATKAAAMNTHLDCLTKAEENWPA